MNMEATQTGATDNDIHTRILGILDAPEPSKPEPVAEEAETEEVTAQAETEGEQPEVKAESTETEQPEADAVELPDSFDGLAEAIGVDTDKLKGLKVRVKIDGQESSVPLAEVLKSYQLEGHVNRKSMELAEQRKAFEAEATAKQTELQTRLQQADSLLSNVEQGLLAQFNAINWDDLRQNDPAEFAAKRQEFAEQYQRVQAAKQQVLIEAQRMQTEHKQKMQNQLQETLKSEHTALLNKLPEWKDETKAKAEKDAIRGYLESAGFANEELSNISDHRAILIARKAMLYDQMQGKKPELTKKVINLPKVQKPGATKTNAEMKAEKQAELRARLRKSGDTKDLAKLLLGRI